MKSKSFTNLSELKAFLDDLPEEDLLKPITQVTYSEDIESGNCVLHVAEEGAAFCGSADDIG